MYCSTHLRKLGEICVSVSVFLCSMCVKHGSLGLLGSLKFCCFLNFSFSHQNKLK